MLPRPPLAREHLGLWRVTQGLMITHLLLAIDALSGPSRHTSVVFDSLRAVMPLWAWGILHAVALLLCLAGLYVDRWGFVRFGYLISFGTFASTTTAFIFAYAVSPVSLYGAALSFLATNLSFTTLFEPKAVLPRA